MMDNQDYFINLPPEEKLRAENELLKLKLQAEFGMEQMKNPLDDKMQNDWLNYIYNFEKQFAENKQVKLYDFINKPPYKKLVELTEEELTQELDAMIEILRANGINLDTICDYDEEVIYKFITEELFEHEMDGMRIEGMMHCFTYEEFHPNHDYDIRARADEFIDSLITKKWDHFMNTVILASEVYYNENLYEQEKFKPIIEAFQNEHLKLEINNWEINSVSFNMETETATLEGKIKYESKTASQIFEGNVKLEMQLEYDCWSVSKVVIPGFSS